MEDLTALIEYTNRGFCHKLHSMEEAERELGRKPILNRLGVVSGRQILAGGQEEIKNHMGLKGVRCQPTLQAKGENTAASPSGPCLPSH